MLILFTINVFFIKINFYVSRATLNVVLAQIQIYSKLNSREQTWQCSVSSPRQRILSATTATYLKYDAICNKPHPLNLRWIYGYQMVFCKTDRWYWTVHAQIV